MNQNQTESIEPVLLYFEVKSSYQITKSWEVHQVDLNFLWQQKAKQM